MPLPSPLRVWTALGIVYVVWGSTYLAIRYAVGVDAHSPGLPPLLMASVRFAIAGLLMFTIAVRRPAADGQPDPLGWPQWRSTALVGLPLLLGGNGLVVVAEKRGVPTGIAAVLVATLPLWMALISAALREERLPPAGIAGLVLGFLGVGILANPFGADHVDAVGAVMLCCASLCWASGSVYSKHATLPRRPAVMTGMEMLWGSAGLLVASLVTGDAFDLHLATVSASAWWGLAYLVVFGSMVAFSAYTWLLRHARLSLVSTYAYVNPVVAVFLGWLFISEKVTLRTVAGSGVVVAGVALIVATRRPPPAPIAEHEEAAAIASH